MSSRKKCPEGCTCGRHTRPKESYRSGSTRCEPGCTCGRHSRVLTEEHRAKIVAANQARKGESHKCPPGCTCDRHKAYYRGGSKKGRTFSPEAVKRIAEGAKNREYSEEALQRLAEDMRNHHEDSDWETERIGALQEALTGTECPVGCTCRKHGTPPLLPQHKNSDGTLGYIYAIEFSTGVVKVGCTGSPRQRINSQIYVASKLGVETKNIWLSVLHEGYAANEILLLGNLGAPARGAEYFKTDFAHVVETAEAIIDRYQAS